MNLNRLFFLSLFSLVLALPACSSSRTPSLQPFPYVKLSFASPPDTIYEKPVRPENPMLEVWRPGYWLFNGTHFIWIPGQLMPRPSPTSVWSPDRWEKRAYGYAFIEGYWQ